MLQNIWELPPPFSVEVSMNTTGLERSALSGNPKSSAVGSPQNEQLGAQAEYDDVNELAAMCHYEALAARCTKMLDPL
jgi:hypothetical protein